MTTNPKAMTTPTAESILDNIEELFQTMRPRYAQTPSMCGRYPCWIVWLPKHGTCERKSLKDALIECQTDLEEARMTTNPRNQ